MDSKRDRQKERDSERKIETNRPREGEKQAGRKERQT